MKYMIERVSAYFPECEEKEIKRAYWREAKQNGITKQSDFKIIKYLVINGLHKRKQP